MTSPHQLLDQLAHQMSPLSIQLNISHRASYLNCFSPSTLTASSASVLQAPPHENDQAVALHASAYPAVRHVDHLP